MFVCGEGAAGWSQPALTSSAANFSTAVNGASSGTLNLHTEAVQRSVARLLGASAAAYCRVRSCALAGRAGLHFEWQLGIRRERDLEGHLSLRHGLAVSAEQPRARARLLG